MFRFFLICVLWIAFLTSFSLQATAVPLPAYAVALDQIRAEAKTLFNKGEYEKAYHLYMRLLREEPDNDEINYNLALSARQTKRYSQALMAFERLVDRYPANTNLRRYLADIYLRLGDRDAARRELAVARQYDPRLTEKSMTRMLDRMESAQTRFQAHGRISGGVMYDSNTNQGPASELMSLGIFDNVLVRGVKAVDSWGSYLNGMLDLGWRLYEDSPWWLVSDLAFYKRWNGNHDLDANNEFAWGRASLGLRHVSSRTLSEVRFKGEMADQRLDQRVGVLGPEAAFIWAVLPNLQLISRAALEKRTYSQDIGRNGTYWWAGQYLRILLGNSGHEMTLGLRAIGASVDYKDYDYNGLETSLRLRVKLTDKCRLMPFASVRRENYNAPATALERDDRRDLTRRTGIFVIYDLTSHLQVEAGAQYVENQSSSPLYRYTQHVFNMGLAWTF